MIEDPIEQEEPSDETTITVTGTSAVSVAPSSFSLRSSLDRGLDHLLIAVLKRD